ncbi:hypothetical protein ILYODFUR_036751 [Ilyodon furcidens]|uniref:Uncharacterized protein n=1 Tax=Ilyodon furcidens TaxID=33524 RepID=A0ABV0U174_9TELE
MMHGRSRHTTEGDPAFSARLCIHEITMHAARGSSTAQTRAGGMAQLLLSMDGRNRLQWGRVSQAVSKSSS